MKQLALATTALAVPTIIRGQSQDIVIAGKPVEIAVSPVLARAIRITVRPVTGGAVPTDGALLNREYGPLSLLKSATSLDNRWRLSVTDNPLTINVTSLGSTPMRLVIDRETGAVSFNVRDEALLALGEGGPQFDRRGSVDRMRSGQGGYQLRTNGGRVPIQWLMGTSGWGLYIHQPLGTFDFSKTTGAGGGTGTFTPPSATPLPLDLFVVLSQDPADLVRAYAEITGFAEMIPLWSLGYLQSHRTLAGPEQILSVARTFRDKKLPCDGLIYLGTDFTPSGWNTHNGEYTFNPANFPDPKGMIDQLHAMNFKIVLHTVIEGQRISGAVSDACTAAPIPPGRTPDRQWPPDRSVPCYWPSHKPLFDLGVDGFWPDQGDDYDAPSRLARIRMYWEGSQQYRPDSRPFALHRNGYAGMQRYGAFLWSGDVYSTWETLKQHVPTAVNCGLSGIPYWGTDIGGFVPTAEYTGELHVRWFQFGAFCPLFRAHGRTWQLRLPWGWNTGSVGISEIAGYAGAADPPESELHNAQVEPICRKYLELRYRLMSYLYSAVRECTQTGLPIIRAMWLHYPADPGAVFRGDQYLWGRDILVAPVVEKGATNRRVYLPAGVWYDSWTRERHDGGREIDRAVDLETMPLFVRAGAIIPMGPVRQFTGEVSDEPTVLTVYPGANGAFTLYDDDGISFAYRQGAWTGIQMAWNDRTRQLTLSLAPGSRMLAPGRRNFQVQAVGAARPQPVTFTGARVSLTL